MAEIRVAARRASWLRQFNSSALSSTAVRVHASTAHLSVRYTGTTERLPVHSPRTAGFVRFNPLANCARNCTRPRRKFYKLLKISGFLGYPFNRSRGLGCGDGPPPHRGEGGPGCWKAPSPANQCATRTSSPPESPASMPAGAPARAQRRVSFGGPPVASNGAAQLRLHGYPRSGL